MLNDNSESKFVYQSENSVLYYVVYPFEKFSPDSQTIHTYYVAEGRTDGVLLWEMEPGPQRGPLFQKNVRESLL